MESPNIINRIETIRKDIQFRIFHPKNWQSVSRRQASSALDPEAKGPVWVSRMTLPPPEDDHARQALLQTIDCLSTNSEIYTKPNPAPVKGEWVGRRRNVSPQAPEPGITEKEKYDGLMSDVSSEVTMLYVHGGAFYSGSPAQSRALTTMLAALTGGRCFAVQYRLAPQHPFPAALLDLLHTYLSLLYPAPATLSPPTPQTLVLTGDSVGANLCLALVQSILSLSRSQSRSPPLTTWNGVSVTLPLPAGVALISPWIDPTYSLPSYKSSANTDYIPPLSICSAPGFPQCEAWPSDPPRADVYCDASCLLHPLVNPASVDSWHGAPPTFILCGEEAPADGAKLVAQQMHAQGVDVRWRQYEGLPHVFVALMAGLEHSKVAMREWAGFCREVVEGVEGFRAGGEVVRVRDLSREMVEMEKLTRLGREEALGLMRAGRDERRLVRREEAKAKM